MPAEAVLWLSSGLGFACPWGTCRFSFRERRGGSWILGLGVLTLLDEGKNTLMRGCSSLWLGVMDRFRTRTGFVIANVAEDLT